MGSGGNEAVLYRTLCLFVSRGMLAIKLATFQAYPTFLNSIIKTLVFFTISFRPCSALRVAKDWYPHVVVGARSKARFKTWLYPSNRTLNLASWRVESTRR